MYFCQRCEFKGDFVAFQSHFYPPDPYGEIYSHFHELATRGLAHSEEARTYLEERGFPEEAIVQFRYGYSDEKVYDKLLKEFSKDELIEAKLWMVNEAKGFDFAYFKRRIIIPYMQGPRYVTFQGRAIDADAKKRYIFLPKSDPCLYHGEDLNKLGRVWLTEGAFKRDALASNDAHAVGLPGATQFKKFLPELRRCKDLWVCLDTEENETGQRMALQIAKALPTCTILTLPLLGGREKIGVDDFILERGYEELLKLPSVRYEHGEPAKPTSLSILVENWKARVESAENKQGFITGHDRLDSWLEGFHSGTLTFLAGAPHMGKTLALEDFALRIHKRFPYTTLDYYSNDDSLHTTITRWVAKLGRLKSKDCRYPLVAFENNEEAMLRYEAAVQKLSMMSDRFQILDRSYNISLERLKERLIKWRKENPKDEKIIFIDAFSKTKTDKDSELRDQIGKSIYKSSLLKDISQEAHVPIIVTHEIPKIYGKRPSSWNLKDSATLEYDADVILLCYQEAHVRGLNNTSIKIEYEDGPSNPVLEVIVAKDKICGTPRSTDLFEIDKQSTRFIEVSDPDYFRLLLKVRESEKREWDS